MESSFDQQALSKNHAMISSSLCLKLLMTFTVIVIGILGTWSLTVKMVTCCRHVKKTLHEFHQSFIQWLRPINDWKDLTDQECENLHTEADDFWITLNGWNSSQNFIPTQIANIFGRSLKDSPQDLHFLIRQSPTSKQRRLRNSDDVASASASSE